MDLYYYKKEIEKYPVISFDMYDTLVNRNVGKVEDVFCVVERLYNKKNSQNKTVTGFKNERIAAYRASYEKLGAACCLDSIYDELTEYDNETKDTLKALEITEESSICTPNAQMVELFNYAKSLGKTVIIITDMYLPLTTIQGILNSCGIKDYKKIFLSADYKMSKTNGKLYDACFKELGIKPKDMLHFGDGLKNDCIRAMLKGIKSIKIKNRTKLDYQNYSDFSEYERCCYGAQQKFISNHLDELCLSHDNHGNIEQLGFEVFAPLVVGFCEWLHLEFEKNGIKKAFFLAREGLLFKTVYEILYPEDSVSSKYLYVSRKSLVPPTYWIYSDYKDVVNSIAKSKELDVATLLKRWGVDSDECKEELGSLNLKFSDILDGRTLLDNKKIQKLYTLLKNKIICQSKRKYSVLEKYLKQEDFGDDCAIVDIGWNGGMHNAFEKIASVWEKPTKIYGYYIGINPKNLGTKLHNIKGYVYDEKHHANNRYYIYSFAGPLELSMTALHDTTIRYELDKNGDAKPLFGSGEYINKDGSLKPELIYTKDVQEGIITYAKVWKKEMLYFFDEMPSEVAFRNCRQFGLEPKLKDLRIFDGFGANDLGVGQHFVNAEYCHLFGKQNIVYGFWASTWKSGFLKKIFKFPFPYYKLYVWMRKRVN